MTDIDPRMIRIMAEHRVTAVMLDVTLRFYRLCAQGMTKTQAVMAISDDDAYGVTDERNIRRNIRRSGRFLEAYEMEG